MIKFKSLNRSDAEKVIELYSQMRDTWFRLDQIRYFLETNPSSGAWSANHLVGFCYSDPIAPNILEIKNIYVDRNLQSSGIGRQLISIIESEATKLKYESLIAVNSLLYNTSIPLKDASHFYKKNGFNKIEQISQTRIFSKKIT